MYTYIIITWDSQYLFVSLAIKTSGFFGPAAAAFFFFFFPDLGNHVAAKLGEPRTYTFLLQCVAIEGQRG